MARRRCTPPQSVPRHAGTRRIAAVARGLNCGGPRNGPTIDTHRKRKAPLDAFVKALAGWATLAAAALR
eukprot:12303761-Alexandrium_andersonii.AAC.1